MLLRCVYSFQSLQSFLTLLKKTFVFQRSQDQKKREAVIPMFA